MRKKISKIIKSAFLLLAIFSSSNKIISVNAQTKDTAYVDKSYTYYVATTKYSDINSWVIGDENPIRRRSDNKLLYCIQAHVNFKDESNVIGYDSLNDKISLSNLSREELERVELLAYYGYGYANHTSLDWYAATQILIWQVTDKVSTPYPIEEGDHSLTRSTRYDAKMNEINDLVNHHGYTVSFNKQKVNLKVGQTVRLTDTNKVLSEYFEVDSNDALNIKIENDDLVITAKKGFEGEVNLKAKTNNNVPLVYDGAQQKCLSRGDPTFISGRINIEATTEFKAIKVYGSNIVWDPNRFTAEWKAFRKENGIKKNVTLHGLRHSNGTFLLSTGMPRKDVAKRLGHSVETLDRVYTHSDDEDDKKMVDILEKAFYGKQKNNNNNLTFNTTSIISVIAGYIDNEFRNENYRLMDYISDDRITSDNIDKYLKPCQDYLTSLLPILNLFRDKSIIKNEEIFNSQLGSFVSFIGETTEINKPEGNIEINEKSF